MTEPERQLTTDDELEDFATWINRQPRHPFKPDWTPDDSEQQEEEAA